MSKTICSIAKEIGSGITPLRSEKSFWDSNDIPWLKTEQLGEYKIFDTNEYISRAALQNTSIKLWPIHTVSIAMYGEGKTRGNASILMAEMTTNQACCNIIVDEHKADYRFLYYWIKHNYIPLRTLAAGVRKNLNSDDIKRFPFPDLSLKQQQAIANVLSSLDERITLNWSICSELEAMAKTLYDYWFVQFDFPDENGKPYRTSGGAMEWYQALGREIPKGWKIDTIDHIISIVRGVSYQPSDELSSLDEDSIKLLKSNNIQDGSINFDSPVYLPSEKANSEQWLTKGSVFITMSSGSKLHMGKTAIVFDDLPFVFGAFCAKIKIESLYQYWLAVYFRHELFRTHIENVTLGTSINNINAHHITSIKLAFPPKEVLERFNAVLSPCFDIQGKIMKEDTQLQNMRDWLLPMLMNGQARIEKEEIQ